MVELYDYFIAMRGFDPDHVTHHAVTDDEWMDWAHGSDDVLDAMHGRSKPGDVDSDGHPLTQAEIDRLAGIGHRIQRAAESNAVKQPTLYRGESYDSREQALARYKHGVRVTHDRLTSASPDPTVAHEYADNVANEGQFPVIVRVQNPHGVPGVQTAPLGVPSNEVVMSAGRTYRVARVKAEWLTQGIMPVMILSGKTLRRPHTELQWESSCSYSCSSSCSAASAAAIAAGATAIP
jgi:hypothetical protein